MELICFAAANIVGFFATAGAAGVDIASSNRNEKDVSLGGLAGVAGATIFTGCLALLIVAGTYGGRPGKGTRQAQRPLEPDRADECDRRQANGEYLRLVAGALGLSGGVLQRPGRGGELQEHHAQSEPVHLLRHRHVGLDHPRGNRGAGNAVDVFKVIGASFGPICGAMAADYLLAGRKWAGPRAGFNPAGWISWAVGFVVGAFGLVAKNVGSLEQYKDIIPAPPVAAFIVGFVLYIILAKAGLESQKLEHPAVKGQ